MRSNWEVAKIIERIAMLLEIKGENPHRVNAYYTAAYSVYASPYPVAEMAKRKTLRTLRGIGASMEKIITEIVETGTCKLYEDLRKEIPESLVELLAIPGLGAKTALTLYRTLGVKTVSDLEQKIRTGEIYRVPGLGRRKIEKIKEGIGFLKAWPRGQFFAIVYAIVPSIKEALMKAGMEASLVGKARRATPLVDVCEFVVRTEDTSSAKQKAKSALANFSVLEEGKNFLVFSTPYEFSVRLIFVDSNNFEAEAFLRTPDEEFLYFLEEKAGGRERLIELVREGDLFGKLGLPEFYPEIMEGWVLKTIEIDKIPREEEVVSFKDIKGDLHVHSTFSDGKATVEEIAKFCAERLGYEYVAIADHSKSLKVARGLQIENIPAKRREIERVNRVMNGKIKVLFATEVDILPDGSLDYPDSVLEGFDLVICAIHSHFDMPCEQMTKRIVRALSHPLVHGLAHPTGRLLKSRPAYAVDVEKIIEVAKSENKFLELNAHPERLDLEAQLLAKAQSAGIKIAINTDAHGLGELLYMETGTFEAKRGTLRKETVINTYSFERFSEFLKGARKR